jgi:hypothetical protein
VAHKGVDVTKEQAEQAVALAGEYLNHQSLWTRIQLPKLPASSRGTSYCGTAVRQFTRQPICRILSVEPRQGKPFK